MKKQERFELEPIEVIRRGEAEAAFEGVGLVGGTRGAGWGMQVVQWGIFLISHLVSVVGVWAWGWKVGELVLLYWLENVFLGLLNVPKILLARERGKGSGAERFFLAPFFVVHYGIFTLVHGVLVWNLFQPAEGVAGGWRGMLWTPDGMGAFLVAFLTMAGGHLVFFFVDFLGGGVFRRVSPGEMMSAPYGRVVALHVTLLLGGLLLQALESPLPGLLLLIVMKMIFEGRTWGGGVKGGKEQHRA